MSTDLKPCPFCGGKAEFERTGTGRQSCVVACGNCGARHESSDEYGRSGDSWNERAASPQPAAQPEQPEPGRLTDARIDAIWSSVFGSMFSGTSKPHDFRQVHRDFARAIEREVLSTTRKPLNQELIWLWTHCRAIGMTEKADSGLMQDDIALFTIDLQASTRKRSDAEVAELDALRARCEAAEALLRHALDALEYHRDQTRPIALTDAAIAGINAHLKGAGRA